MIFQCLLPKYGTRVEKNRKLSQSVKEEKDTEALNLKSYLFLNEVTFL
jgi:hypothetical protein